MRWRLLSVLGLLALTACGFAHDEPLVGRYHLVGVDAREEMTLCWTFDNGSCHDLGRSTLYAAGYNDRYVVAAIHPQGARTAATEYLIVTREPARESSEDGEPRNIATVTGEAQYAIAKARLGLPDFTVVFDDLK